MLANNLILYSLNSCLLHYTFKNLLKIAYKYFIVVKKQPLNNSNLEINEN